MAIVKDRGGREWEIKLDVSTIDRVNRETGRNLGLPLLGEPPLILALTLDPVSVSVILWSIVKPFATTLPKMNEDVFYEIFTGDTFTQAKTALFAELLDFFRRRKMDQIADTVQAALGMMPALLEQAMQPIRMLNSGALSGSGPVSPTETPDPSPSGNSTAQSGDDSTSKADAPVPLPG